MAVLRVLGFIHYPSHLIILSPHRCQRFTRISNRAMLCDLFRFNQMNWFCLVSWLCYDLIFSDSESNEPSICQVARISRAHIRLHQNQSWHLPYIPQVLSHRITETQPNYSCTLIVMHYISHLWHVYFMLTSQTMWLPRADVSFMLFWTIDVCHKIVHLLSPFFWTSADKMWMWMKRKTSHLVLDCVVVVRLVTVHWDVEFVCARVEKRLMQSERNIQLIWPKWQTLAIIRFEMHIYSEENLNVFLWNFSIPSSSQTHSLRWTFHYKLLVNNSDTQLSFLLLLITFIWKTVNLCVHYFTFL